MPLPAADAAPSLVAADDRTQALFDQAVRLVRRNSGQSKAPDEPQKSILTEISLYHDNEQASYLSVLSVAPKRVGPICIGPWAQAELARFDMQKKSYSEAVTDYGDLAERFKGYTLTEASDGPEAASQPAELVGLDGVIEAALELAEQNKDEKNLGTLDALGDRIRQLQKLYGSQAVPCSASANCGTYSDNAISYLWQALALDKADQGKWTGETFDFIKHESDPDVQAKVLVALAEGEIKLQHLKDAKAILEQVAKKDPASMALNGDGSISAFGIYAVKRRLELAQGEGKDVDYWKTQVETVYQEFVDVLKKSRSPQMSDAYFNAGLDAILAQLQRPVDAGLVGLPQGVFSNLIPQSSN